MKIPKKWSGQSCYIIGGGWSLKNVDIKLFSGKNLIGVNNSYSLLPDIEYCWFNDFRWYEWNEEKIKQRITSEYPIVFASCHPRFRNCPVVQYVERSGGCGIEIEQDKVHGNYCSGFAAVNFAFHLGANPIILLGFDMRTNPNPVEGNNWHSDHQPAKGVFRKTQVLNPYPLFMKAAEAIKKDIGKLSVTILNATEGSAIPDEIFPHITIQEALEL